MKDDHMNMKNRDVDIFEMIENAYKNKLPFVAYRKPENNLINGIFQKNDRVHYSKDYQESGFIFAPFDNKEPSILFPLPESTLIACQFGVNFTIELEKNKTSDSNSDHDIDEYITLVAKGIKFLEKNNFKKVVLSRKETKVTGEIKIVDTLKQLLTCYYNAFVYCWYHPKVGLWLGATPETLLKVKEDSFETMALAGTQVYDSDNAVKWRAKETEEQQYVTDFILEQLNKSSFERPELVGRKTNEFKVSEPYTVKAGNLLHLRTDILGKLSDKLSLKKIIYLLHPTPAVCGVPKQETKDFILQNENYNRQYYTGFLGELNLENTSNLFVNLRCMQVFENHIEIYIGGGITTESNPQSEWEETVAKTKVMLKVLE